MQIAVHNDYNSYTFTAFKGLLVETSGFFECALSGRWESNNDGKIDIENDSNIFQLFLNYANTGRIVDGLEKLDIEYATIPSGSDKWPLDLGGAVYDFKLDPGNGIWSISFPRDR